MAKWNEFLEEARGAALEAGPMLPSGLEERRQVSYKAIVDLLTTFRHQAQGMIFVRLSAAFPGHGFLAEEGLNRGEQGEFRWVIDPPDGTTNFAHRFPVFTVSIALENQGRVILGVVYDPMRDEMFEAVQGEGAFLNRRRVRVSAVDDLNRSLLSTGFPYDLRDSPVNNIDHFNHFLIRAQAVRRCGSAAMDLRYGARGRVDGGWELTRQARAHAPR